MSQHGYENFDKLDTLTIDVVGASNFELPADHVWEEILHCIPNIRELRVVLIGPQATSFLTEENKEKLIIPALECCPHCTKEKRNRYIAMHAATYHEYYASVDFSMPHLIVAFNTGMHEENTQSWETSLDVILDLDVPSIFTSWSEEEADKDYHLLQKHSAKLLTSKPVLNPVLDIQPNPDPWYAMDHYYENNMFCMAFKGRRS